jgi:hypothetical protein
VMSTVFYLYAMVMLALIYIRLYKKGD